MKQSILRAVSRSAARLLLIHVFVLNKGREPFNDFITSSTNGLPALNPRGFNGKRTEHRNGRGVPLERDPHAH